MADAVKNFEIAGAVLHVRKDPRYDDPEFRQACTDLIDAPGPELIIDMTKVKFVSSREISVLVTAVKRAKDAGKKLRIRASVAVYGIFRILKLDGFLNIERVEESANA